MQRCKDAGAKRALPLKVSGPFHSSLMKPAANKLAERLADVEFTVPSIPILHNVDVKTRDTVDGIKSALSDQVASAVLWSKTILEMESMGIETIYECGPGAALTGMVKRITPSVSAKSINTLEAIDMALKEG